MNLMGYLSVCVYVTVTGFIKANVEKSYLII